MSLKSSALNGVLERLQGRTASRMQALVAAVGAGAVVYKLLRSGGGDDEADADDADDAAK